MTSTDSATAGAPGAGAVPGKVFRSELNPVDFLHRAAYLYPDKTAVVDGERRYSYRQLAERSWRLANALRSSGLGKGDRVATLLFNSSAMLEAHFGVPAAGGILVAVNHRLASAEVGYILAHSGARYLLLDAGLEALAAPLDLAGVTVIRCARTGDPEDPYGQFLAGASPERPASWLEHEEETISVNYTSGTTGRPKGVQYTYRGAYLNALSEVIHAKTWKTSRPPGVVVHLMQGPEPGAAAAQPGHDGPSPTTGSPRSARPPQTAAMTRSWTRCCCGCTPRACFAWDNSDLPGSIQISPGQRSVICGLRNACCARCQPCGRRGPWQPRVPARMRPASPDQAGVPAKQGPRGDDQAKLADLTARQQTGQRSQDRPVSPGQPGVLT